MSEKSVEEVLTGIADELLPEARRIVAEIGYEQVCANVLDGIAKIAERQEVRELLRHPKGTA